MPDLEFEPEENTMLEWTASNWAWDAESRITHPDCTSMQWEVEAVDSDGTRQWRLLLTGSHGGDDVDEGCVAGFACEAGDGAAADATRCAGALPGAGAVGAGRIGP